MSVKYPANRPLTDAEEAEIQAMIASDPDSPEITDEEFARMRPAREVMPPEFFEAIKKARAEKLSRGRPKIAAPKEAVTLRIEPDIILRFKKSSKNWRVKMQEALKKAAMGL